MLDLRHALLVIHREEARLVETALSLTSSVVSLRDDVIQFSQL
jgi:hypothetical protein